jgi:DNA invertase Pin-like site-specific DNA recombinase
MCDGTRAALYARISTKEGQQHLENQLAQLRTFAGKMKWSIAGEYTDQASGASSPRPGLDQMMKHAARRRFDVVTVFDLSRLTRGGPMHAFSCIARLNSSRVEFWSMTEEHFRSSGPYGQLFIAIAAHIAEQELNTLRSRIKAGLARVRKAGRKLGPPKKVIDQARLDQLRGAGKGVREIAAVLKVSKSTIHRRLQGRLN